jgi:Ser/Thr protein kinase RdoA (MazF antagonist)
MMKLSSMKNVIDAVSSDWRSPLAEIILERWGYDEGSVYFYRASTNFLFLFKQHGETYYLRFSDSREKDLSTLTSELNILEYFRGKPIDVALPIPSKEGNTIEVVETELGTFYSVVFEAIPGRHLEIEELDEKQFYQWGAKLGELHQHFKNMPDEYRLSRKSWRDQLVEIQNHLSSEENAAKQELTNLLMWAAEQPCSQETFGLIHYDFELDNHRWDDDKIGIIDFDDCQNHWYAADIAFALRDLLKDASDLADTNLQAFVNGYQTYTVLAPHSLEQLPWFIRMHNLISYIHLSDTIDLPQSENDPEWLSNLRSKLLNRRLQYLSLIESAVLSK